MSSRRLDRARRSLRLVLPLTLLLTEGCETSTPEPAGEEVLDGTPPTLRSWSGSAGCCGEDPHPVHGAVLADGSVVMVGKAAAAADQTAGFITRWRAPEGPATGRFVDGADDIILATRVRPPDSSLLQVADGGEVLVAVGFEADDASAQATAVALALDPSTLDVRSRLVIPSPTAGRSSALESIVIDGDGLVVLGGAWELPREAIEGFKSYGNVVGGRGLVAEFPLTAWLDLATDGVDVTLEELDATTRDIEETFSVKSLRRWADGSLVAVASDADEQSGVLWVDPGLTGHLFTTFDDGVELTDVVPFRRPDMPDAAALVGHGGEGTIDGKARLVTPEGETLWTQSFGNPGLDPSEVPSGGLAPDAFIFDECWGVDQRGAELVIACGSGIEGCDAVEAGAADTAACEGDPRRSWRSFLVGIDAEGAVVWSRAESFVESTGEASESAAEFVVVGANGDVYAIIDQVFGVGLARYGN